MMSVIVRMIRNTLCGGGGGGGGGGKINPRGGVWLEHVAISINLQCMY